MEKRGFVRMYSKDMEGLVSKGFVLPTMFVPTMTQSPSRRWEGAEQVAREWVDEGMVPRRWAHCPGCGPQPPGSTV